MNIINTACVFSFRMTYAIRKLTYPLFTKEQHGYVSLNRANIVVYDSKATIAAYHYFCIAPASRGSWEVCLWRKPRTQRQQRKPVSSLTVNIIYRWQ